MIDPLETHADAAQQHYGFTDGERDEFLRMQRRLAGDPTLLKKLIKRQRKFLKAQGMSPTIKTRSSRAKPAGPSRRTEGSTPGH